MKIYCKKVFNPLHVKAKYNLCLRKQQGFGQSGRDGSVHRVKCWPR